MVAIDPTAYLTIEKLARQLDDTYALVIQCKAIQQGAVTFKFRHAKKSKKPRKWIRVNALSKRWHMHRLRILKRASEGHVSRITIHWNRHESRRRGNDAKTKAK